MDIIDKLTSTVRNVPDFPKPGIQFKDITPLLDDPRLMRACVTALAAPFEDAQIDKVLGIEARGFILGGMLAQHLGAGFVPVRKKGKLPYKTLQETYALEYGADAIEMHIDALREGHRVLIHDDVIATGGTAAAACRLAGRAGAQVVGCAFLVELSGLEGRRLLADHLRVHTVLHF